MITDALTPREREVLQLIWEGQSTKELAHTLGISPKTAERHRETIGRKLGAGGTVRVIRRALAEGLITLP